MTPAWFWWSGRPLFNPSISLKQIYFYTNKKVICNHPITPDLSSADTHILLFKLLSYEYAICTLSAKLTSITTKARTNEIAHSYCLRIPCCVRVHSCKQLYDVIPEERICNPHIARGWSFLGGHPIFIWSLGVTMMIIAKLLHCSALRHSAHCWGKIASTLSLTIAWGDNQLSCNRAHKLFRSTY